MKTALIILLAIWAGTMTKIHFNQKTPRMTQSAEIYNKIYAIALASHDGEWLERIYLSKDKAEQYVARYKDNHNYTIQEIKIEE